MKVVITNAVLANAGDAAICLGIIAALVDRGVAEHDEIVILDSHAAITAPLYPELEILQQPMVRGTGSRVQRIALVLVHFTAIVCLVSLGLGRRCVGRVAPTAIRSYVEADLIVSTGGTYLVEHYRIWPRLAELVAVSFGRAPLVLWTQSLGPFRRTSSRFLVRALLARAALVMLRDERSRDHLLALEGRCADKLLVVPDAAFALAGAPPTTVDEREIAAVISVREWTKDLDGCTTIDTTRYERAMQAAATRLTGDSAKVLALSTCQGLIGYGTDDSAYASRLFAAVPGVVVDRDFHRPEDLMNVLRRTRVVIATRMHLAILALMSGCQVVAIAYEFKTAELFTGCGLGSQVITLADCTPDAVGLVLDGIQTDRSAARLSDSAVVRLAAAAAPSRELFAAVTARMA